MYQPSLKTLLRRLIDLKAQSKLSPLEQQKAIDELLTKIRALKKTGK